MAIFYATFPSLSIHFAGCYDLARFWIWSFRTFKTYILIIKSQQNYSNFVCFENYLRISVSIGTSAKCRSYTVILLKADTLFFKTKVIYSLFIRYAQFFHFMLFFAFQNCLLWCAETKTYKRQTCIQENGDYSRAAYCISSVAQKQNSVDFSNSSCRLVMLSKVSYQKSRIASPQVIWILKKYNKGFKCSLTFFHVYIYVLHFQPIQFISLNYFPCFSEMSG